MRRGSDWLKFQAGFAGRVGERGDAAMVLVGTAIEANGGNTRLGGPLGQRFADGLGRLLVAAVLELGGELLVARRSAGERLAVEIVDDLGGNVLVAARDAQSRPLVRAAGALADAKCASLALASDFLLTFHGTWVVRCLCDE